MDWLVVLPAWEMGSNSQTLSCLLLHWLLNTVAREVTIHNYCIFFK